MVKMCCNFRKEVMKVNLKRYYNHHTNDYFVEMGEEEYCKMMQCDMECRNLEHSQKMKDNYWNLSYNLELYENYVCLSSQSAEAEYLQIKEIEELYMYLDELTEKERKRIMAFFFLGLSVVQIAIADGVSKQSVQESIQNGLDKLYQFFISNQ